MFQTGNLQHTLNFFWTKQGVLFCTSLMFQGSYHRYPPSWKTWQERCNIFLHFSGLWGYWINSFPLSSCIFYPVRIQICFTHTAQLLPSQFTSSLVFLQYDFFPLFISDCNQFSLPLFSFSLCATHGLLLLGIIHLELSNRI